VNIFKIIICLYW